MDASIGKRNLIVDESYSRADTSLWDDSDLVRLWNEQLKVMNSKEGTGRLSLPREPSLSQGSGAEADSHAESSSRASESVERSTPSPTVTASEASYPGITDREPHKRARQEPGNALALQTTLPIAHLPREVRQLVVSFYTAGYEAGRYAACNEARQGKEKRSRH
ncbi:unnamed protein product [Phytomonas sp. EM1]|nr:unnamed protein product [Phytomonas sp. EM1]|eukprot:CCW62831.1 unnamed protein product [Phytomonas sp. isolate EM1]